MNEQTINELRDLLQNVRNDNSLNESKELIDTLHTSNNPMWIKINGGFAKTKIDEYEEKIQLLLNKVDQILPGQNQ